MYAWQSKTPCLNGPSCRYFKKGKCRYLHMEEKKMSSKKVKEAKLNTTIAEIRVSTDAHKLYELKTEAARIDKEYWDLCARLPQTGFDSSHPLYEKWDKLRVLHNQYDDKVRDMEHSMTPCHRGAQCTYFYPTFPFSKRCSYFHLQEEIAAFEDKRRVDICEHEAREYEKKLQRERNVDAVYYRERFTALGCYLKASLPLPDEICSLIRSYCCTRDEFLPKSEHDFQYYPLLRCYSNVCEGLIAECNDGYCTYCGGHLMNGGRNGPMFIQRGDSIVFLHKDCAVEYGFTVEEKQKPFLRGEAKEMLKDARVFMYLPYNLCFLWQHMYEKRGKEKQCPCIVPNGKLEKASYCSACRRVICECSFPHTMPIVRYG